MSLILSARTAGALHRAAAGIDWSVSRWAYLGPGRPPATLPASAKLDLRPQLAECFDRTRQSYIDYVAELTATAASADWISGVVAEKNPYISRVFLHAACTEVCRGEAAAHPERTLLLVVEDPDLRALLRANIDSAAASRFGDEAWPSAVRWLKAMARRWGNLARFAARHARRVIVARHRLRLHELPAIHAAVGHAQVTIAHAWVDLRAVDLQTGDFRDTDFTGVGAHLTARGALMLTLPAVGYDAPYDRVMAHIAETGRACLVPDAFLRLSDVAREVWREAWRAPVRYPGVVPAYRGLNMMAAITRDCREEWLGARRLKDGLQDAWVRRLAGDGIRVARAIYPYENHTWERAWGASLRRWHPGVRVIGYQPNGLPQMLLNYFNAASEADASWLPDVIVTNGTYATRALLASGYSRARLRDGGGLRQPHVRAWLASPLPERPRGGRRPRVLVTPSIGTASTVDLIDKAVAAFTAPDNVDVWLKLHPAVSAAVVLDGRAEPLPPWITVVRESLSTLLPQVDVLLYNDGTFPGAEALAAGIPVISVDLDFGLPLDALDAYPEVRQRVRTPEEIAAAVRVALTRDADEHRAFCGLARRVAGELVGPVNDAVLDLFAD